MAAGGEALGYMAMSVDTAWKGVYRAGGVSFLIEGILFILLVLVGFLAFTSTFGGEFPTTAEEYLTSYADQRLLFQTFDGIFALAIILLIPLERTAQVCYYPPLQNLL